MGPKYGSLPDSFDQHAWEFSQPVLEASAGSLSVAAQIRQHPGRMT